nr:hypothetical protein Iba_chr02fCG9430 [Ipomoea batatas]
MAAAPTDGTITVAATANKYTTCTHLSGRSLHETIIVISIKKANNMAAERKPSRNMEGPVRGGRVRKMKQERRARRITTGGGLNAGFRGDCSYTEEIEIRQQGGRALFILLQPFTSESIGNVETVISIEMRIWGWTLLTIALGGYDVNES